MSYVQCRGVEVVLFLFFVVDEQQHEDNDRYQVDDQHHLAEENGIGGVRPLHYLQTEVAPEQKDRKSVAVRAAHQPGEPSEYCKHLPAHGLLREAAQAPQQQDAQHQRSDILIDEGRSEEAVELEMLEMLRQQHQRLQREGGYLEEGRIGHHQRDVDNNADADEQSC